MLVDFDGRVVLWCLQDDGSEQWHVDPSWRANGAMVKIR